MCAAPILEMQDVHVRFGGVHAIAGLSFTVTRGEILSIIGPNGAGKTSVLNCISGHRRPIAGGIAFEATTEPLKASVLWDGPNHQAVTSPSAWRCGHARAARVVGRSSTLWLQTHKVRLGTTAKPVA
jgi:ABC-type branched-subunit amino acid transport system ATPase component